MNSKPTIHIFKEFNVGKTATTRYYKLEQTINGISLLTKEIKIENDRKFAKSKPVFWTSLRVNNKWQTPRLTGLFKTPYKNIYIGDTEFKRNLLVFKFSVDAQSLKVYYFKDYYTRNLREIFNSIG